MDQNPLYARLKPLSCPACSRFVVLEPGAKEGDVIVCPGCQNPVVISLQLGQYMLSAWKRTSV